MPLFDRAGRMGVALSLVSFSLTLSLSLSVTIGGEGAKPLVREDKVLIEMADLSDRLKARLRILVELSTISLYG